ncbi:MAG: hypothetical protein KF842_10680 [Caulobacter sp.]|nr:hypothetical protein [Caulobacter sp.]
MQQTTDAGTRPARAAGLEAMRGPRVRVRLAASVGGDLLIDGRLRPAIGLKEGGLRGRALVYRLTEVEGEHRRLDPTSLNSVDAGRVDMAAMEAAFGALEPPAPGERPPLLILPVNWTTLRSEKSRRRLLRRAAVGQIEHGVLALCEVIGLDPGTPRTVLHEVTGGLKPIFRGVLARTRPDPPMVRHLAGCGFTGASILADRLEAAEDEKEMLRRVLMLQTIGPGILIHGVGSVLALGAARAAGASWASLDITPGGREAGKLLEETKAAAGLPRPPHIVDPT